MKNIILSFPPLKTFVYVAERVYCKCAQTHVTPACFDVMMEKQQRLMLLLSLVNQISVIHPGCHSFNPLFTLRGEGYLCRRGSAVSQWEIMQNNNNNNSNKSCFDF